MSVSCPECQYENEISEPACNLCGTLLGSKELPMPSIRLQVDAEQRREEQKLRDDVRRARQRRRRRSHAWTGAFTFFLLYVLFNPPGFAPMLLLIAAVLSLVVGAFVGFLISAKGGGILEGALISSGVFALIQGVAVVPSLLHGSELSVPFWKVIVVAIVVGAVPGGIIGAHVESDN